MEGGVAQQVGEKASGIPELVGVEFDPIRGADGISIGSVVASQMAGIERSHDGDGHDRPEEGLPHG